MVYPAPVWTEINLSAIAHNTKEIRRITSPGARVMAVVKANAYGHGLVQVAQTVLQNGADTLGVARADEGVALRNAGIKAPILILGYTVPEQMTLVLKNNLIPTIYSLTAAKELSTVATDLGVVANLHLKIDTGMGRLGFLPGEDAARQIKQICQLPSLHVAGVYTHFASMDEKDKTYGQQQMRVFMDFTDDLIGEGISLPCRHIAGSAGVLEEPSSHLGMVRPGIVLYGYYPSDQVNQSQVDLMPAMTLKARIAHVKKVPVGTGISYGVTHVTSSATTIATIPVGYADGYNRLLSAQGEVLIHGVRAPVLGRVCMDQLMVDVGHIPNVKIDEEVVLLGKQGNQQINADEIAHKIGTICYEVLCLISARVPRVFI